MSTFPRSPKLLRAGLVIVDPDSGKVKRVIALQYNPDSLSRSLQIQGTGEGGERSEALRLKGPAVETIKLEAEIDAADQLEFPDKHANMVRYGIQPQLAALEGLISPTAESLIAGNGLGGCPRKTRLAESAHHCGGYAVRRYCLRLYDISYPLTAKESDDERARRQNLSTLGASALSARGS